jgi:hypothetical protein
LEPMVRGAYAGCGSMPYKEGQKDVVDVSRESLTEVSLATPEGLRARVLAAFFVGDCEKVHLAYYSMAVGSHDAASHGRVLAWWGAVITR